MLCKLLSFALKVNLQPTNVVLQTNATPADARFPENTLEMLLLQLAPAPKTHLPAKPSCFYYNPSIHLSETQGENGAKGMTGEGPGFVHKQKAEGENNNRCNKFKTNTSLPLRKSHCSPKKKTLARCFRKGAKGQKQ